MTHQDIALWWTIGGIITCIIGTYRHLKGITDEPSPFIVMSWFLLPIFYLPMFIVRILFYKIRRFK